MITKLTLTRYFFATDLRFALLSLGGYMRYDSRIPGVQNPQQTGSFSVDALAPARIRFGNSFAYGGYMTLRVALH